MSRHVSHIVTLLFVMTLISLGSIPAFAQIHFTQDPILMVDPVNETFNQESASSSFDYHGNIHTVWIDNRDGNLHSQGSALLADGTFVGSYTMYTGTGSDNHTFIRTFPSITDVNTMFSIVLNEDSSPDFEFCGVELNINDFPSIPYPVVTFCVSTGTTSVDVISMVETGGKIFYALDDSPDIRLRAYDVSSQTWDTVDAIIPGLGNISLSHPQIAVDEDDFIYVVYDRYDSGPPVEHNIGARRSMSQADLSGGFYPENIILATASTSGYFSPEVAVTGSYSNLDLLFICTYLDPNPLTTKVNMVTDWMGDWTIAFFLTSTTDTLNTDNSSGIFVQGPESAFDVDGETVYVIWTDDRTGTSELYLRAVSNAGSILSDEFLLTDGDTDVEARPHISTGFNPGDIAITYIDDDCPFLLMSRSTFYDTCDNDPSLHWTTHSGITIDNTMYHGQPASYRFETSMTRGALLQDYGTTEQTGSVSLFFYDTPSITTENFIVTLNNDNSKGIIRMLGVRNETTPTNYSYNDGSGWIDWGVIRTPGWHEVIMSVDASGITMQIEGWEGLGDFSTVTEPTFTSFTSIEIEGGGTAGSYNVDDIRVEANPVIYEPLPIPSSSPFFLLLGIILIGGIFVWSRR
ncbi:hypothetical protein K8T06_02680 [bacterium]|nr:hypothetical protein [bacterium]